MSEAKEVRQRARELRNRLAALRAGAGEDRNAQFQAAALEEELYDCTQRLKELLPRHRVSYRTTHAGWSLDRCQFERWAQGEDEEEPDEDGARKLRILKAAKNQPTEKQRDYLAALEGGLRQSEVARERGVDKSTVSRTVRRGNGALTAWARRALRLQELAGEADVAGTVALDLSAPAVLAEVSALLTERQQLYLYLYYGEWQSLQEISTLLNVDKATVLRTIRRGLERLDACFCGGVVRMEGMESLEELLMAGYGLLTSEELRPAPARPPGPPRPGNRRAVPPVAQADTVLEEEIVLTLHGKPELLGYQVSSRLLDFLEERVREWEAAGTRPALRRQTIGRALRALFRRLRERMRRWRGWGLPGA